MTTIFAVMSSNIKTSITKSLLAVLIIGIYCIRLNGQNEMPLIFNDSLIQRFEKVRFPEKCRDSVDLLLQVDSLNRTFFNFGYLSASMDSFRRQDDKFRVYYNPGDAYRWMYISPGNISESLLESVGFYPKLWEDEPVNYGQLAGVMTDLLDHFANSGYPFANIQMDSVQIRNGRVFGKLCVNKNKIIRFDSLTLISTVAINPVFLERHLGLRKGDPYNHSTIREIPGQIRKLSFVRLDGQPTVSFKGNRAIVNLKLAPYKNSRFDILIGILPGQNATDGIRLTGDITAELFNKLGQGEYAGFKYKSITRSTQELALEVNYPYLLNLPFGINSTFTLYSNTKLNRDIDLRLGVQYHLGTDQKLNIYWHNTSSRLLAIDSAKILAQGRLPSNIDLRVNGIGLNYAYQKLNYRFNPRSGINLFINGKAGLKEVLENQEIKSLNNELTDFSMAYDSLENGYQFSIDGLVEYYLPVGKIFTMKGANRSGIKLSRKGLYLNEAFRIGGSEILRGFDEESLFTNRFSIFTLEMRMLISMNSYFFIFGDYGLVSIRLDDTIQFDRPYGIGTGLSFDTGAGILQVSAALGSQSGLPLDFGSSKIHVGYLSLF
jgi:hemolysin activation/secretion protein